jgi:hypothetical protein
VPEILDPPIPDAENWADVQYLIAEVQQAERTAARYAAAIHMLDVAIRLFRIIERKQLFEQTPREEDLKIHEALLHALISAGQLLIIRIAKISDDDLAGFGIRRVNLLAYVQELQDTFLMWHGPELKADRKADLEKAIFGSSA